MIGIGFFRLFVLIIILHRWYPSCRVNVKSSISLIDLATENVCVSHSPSTETRDKHYIYQRGRIPVIVHVTQQHRRCDRHNANCNRLSTTPTLTLSSTSQYEHFPATRKRKARKLSLSTPPPPEQASSGSCYQCHASCEALICLKVSGTLPSSSPTASCPAPRPSDKGLR